MASSSSAPRSWWRYDVFPSFSGGDVRKSFLSHLMEKLKAKSIITFKDHGIERSRPIAPELLLAIRESMIAIVIFSKSYASSTWCLNELLEIHKCYEELKQMVIPVFYDVDPSHVRKQTGEFGKSFEETCKGKTEDVKQRWMRVLTEVANMAGEDSRNWSDEASLIEKITKDVSNKIIIRPSDCFGDFVGIESHIEAMKSMLCLESEEAIMVGILGPSGIGKTTIARALYSQLYNKFDYRTFFVPHGRTNRDSYGMKLCWEEQLLSEILDEKDMKISHLGVVKQRLKHKKVFIVLDDVIDLELLKTLVGQAGWFGPGSRIIVITQDRQLLKSHNITCVYEVDFPSREVALQILCRSAFGQNSPPHGFTNLATEVTELSGYLPLGLDIMGSSLAGRDMEDWVEMMPRLQNSLDGRIEKTLAVGYHGLDARDQEIFLYIACLLNGHKVKYIRNFLGDSVNFGLKILAEKSLIRIVPQRKTVEMHSLLQMLGKEIVRAESIHSPGKRRFLMDAEDIRYVLTDNTGTESVLGISFNTSEINEPLFIDENSFEGMHNLRFLKFYKKWSQQSGEGRLYLPQGLVSLPRKLKILYWDGCPLKCIPYNFRAEYLVEFTMNDSKLEKLWQGTQRLPSLKKMTLRLSKKLKEIPDLSYAINLEKMDLFRCTSLVTLPSSIRKLDKLRVLKMSRCSNLEVLPTDVNLESLDYLDFRGCSRLRDFPKFSRNISLLYLDGTAIEEEDSVWIENITMFTDLDWNFCPLRYLPSNFHPEYLVHFSMIGSKLEKLWEGVQSLENLLEMDLSSSENLQEFPNLSKATNLKKLHLNHCKSLKMVPSSIGSLSKVCELNMEGCTGIESLPTNMDLESLNSLDLSGCSQLRDFPQISTSIQRLFLDNTAIEEVPSWIENFSELTKLTMSGCHKLKNISPNICKLKYLKLVNFSDCEGVTEIGDASVMTRISRTIDDRLAKSEEAFILLKLLLLIVVKLLTLCAKILKSLQGVSHSFYNPYARLKFHNCLSLDRGARKLIIQSDFEYAVLPGGEVPKYFMHRAYGSSLTIPLPESSLFDKFLGFKVCIVFEPPTEPEVNLSCIEVRWCFRGRNGVYRFHFDMYSTKMDHLLVFHFGFPTEEVTECPSELVCDDVKFELYYRIYDCFCNPESHTETCPCSVQTIKGCGIEFWDVPPPLYDDRIISETELNMSCCSSFSDDGEYLEDHLIEDDLSFSSCFDEAEYLENIPSETVSTPEAIAQWLFEFDGELEGTYHC